jgi:hypothetical protein
MLCGAVRKHKLLLMEGRLPKQCSQAKWAHVEMAKETTMKISA